MQTAEKPLEQPGSVDRAMHPSVPRKIDKYEVLGVVARGGMGVVYKALDRALERSVAIKMVTGTGEEQRQGLKRFYREAQFTASLRHPNIVTVYDLGEFQGTPYLVMEYLPGRSLQSLLEDQTMTLAEKVRCIRQVCEGLQYAHSRQPSIIHRDIKPANIMVLEDGMVKLIDFGIARLGQSKNTRTGFVMGTYQYMSPEQIKNIEIDGRSDIFSTGVVLFHLLTHRLPFEGANVSQTLDLILNRPAPPLHGLLLDYPRALDGIMARALAKRREERYQSADEFAFDLLQIESDLKRGSFGERLSEAERLVHQGDYERAKLEVARVLEVDSHHREAGELMTKVQRALAVQQRQKRALHLRLHAEEALQLNRISDAFSSIEQALRLDSQNPELRALREKILLKEKVNQALLRAERSLSSGRLDEAMRAVEDALRLDPESVRAKSFKVMIEAKLAERGTLREQTTDYGVKAKRTTKTTTSLKKRSSELKRMAIPEPRVRAVYAEPDPVWSDECFASLRSRDHQHLGTVQSSLPASDSASVYSPSFEFERKKIITEQVGVAVSTPMEVQEAAAAEPVYRSREEKHGTRPQDGPYAPGGAAERSCDGEQAISRRTEAWSYESLQTLENNLSPFLGALAKVVVRKAALQARSSSDLVQLVADSIKERKDRQAFLEQNASWPNLRGIREGKNTTSSSAALMSERRRVVLGLAEIDRASRLLAEYIGPLAGVLAKKASKEAASLQEFYRLLAKHVKSGSERSRFLRDAGVNES